MDSILVIEAIGYFGVIFLQSVWYLRGELTEQRFALFQIASLALIMITKVIGYSKPEYPFGLLAGSIGTVIFALIGYPILRWVYRQMFPR